MQNLYKENQSIIKVEDTKLSSTYRFWPLRYFFVFAKILIKNHTTPLKSNLSGISNSLERKALAI